MQEFLAKQCLNKAITVRPAGGGDSLSGRVRGVSGGVLTLEQDGCLTFVAVDKIFSVAELG
ncbi:MAG: hypothetical protein HY576_02310 [candidate division NC10 bacterium]|nr:hypothetical protein [candidate division NC10 bacterium]